MKIKSFTFNPFSENTYVLYHEKTRKCIVTDPGNFNENEFQSIVKFIESTELKPIGIYNTHCHIDHVFGVRRIMEHFEIPFYAHKLELDNIRSFASHGAMFGINGLDNCPSPNGFIDESTVIDLGEGDLLTTKFVPGHSPGHLAFYSAKDGFIVAGDVLFHQGVGRTDLPGGDLNVLLASIKNELYTLPEETKVYAGHMISTTIKKEKASNPWTRSF